MNKRAEKFLLKIVQEGYEEIAEAFNETRKKPMKPLVYKIVEDLSIKEGYKILDVGCGNGCFLEVLLDKKSLAKLNYLGIDNSVNLIKYAQEKYGVKFKVNNIVNLENLKENNFDYIFSWAVLHHLPGSKVRLSFLKDIYNKLNKEGSFIFSVWKLRKRKNFLSLKFQSFFKQILQGRILDFNDLIFDWKGDKNGKNQLRYYHAFSKKSLNKLISKSKFKIEKFLEDDFNYYYILKK